VAGGSTHELSGRGGGVEAFVVFSTCLMCTDPRVLSVATSDGRLLPTAFQFAVNQIPSGSASFIPSILKIQ
jgi:hypothetical protein